MPQLFTPIVGARYRPPAPQVLSLLGQDQPLVLRREPENEHDGNAIAVELGESNPELDAALKEEDITIVCPFHLGYIPREIAANWAPVFDDEGAVPECKLGFDANGRPAVVVEIPGALDDLPEDDEELPMPEWNGGAPNEA